ncbi:MAG: hypothetical protein J3K34DRAFT_415445 [Monoraphidium minutum]|nr:MAG: hypothetical protein J3K34DRAFT_415445 [Monoraphidium minutum]
MRGAARLLSPAWVGSASCRRCCVVCACLRANSAALRPIHSLRRTGHLLHPSPPGLGPPRAGGVTLRVVAHMA